MEKVVSSVASFGLAVCYPRVLHFCLSPCSSGRCLIYWYVHSCWMYKYVLTGSCSPKRNDSVPDTHLHMRSNVEAYCCNITKSKYEQIVQCTTNSVAWDRHCGLVVRVPGYKSRGPGSISGATRFSEKLVGLERGLLCLMSTIFFNSFISNQNYLYSIS
jgi:hypothetical protein